MKLGDAIAALTEQDIEITHGGKWAEKMTPSQVEKFKANRAIYYRKLFKAKGSAYFLGRVVSRLFKGVKNA